MFQKQRRKMLSERDANSCDLEHNPASLWCVQETNFPARQLFLYDLPARPYEPCCASLRVSFCLPFYLRSKEDVSSVTKLATSQMLWNLKNKKINY